MHSVIEMEGFSGKVKGNKWVIDGNVRKTLVIIHGMNEYSYRYREFAEFLNRNGYDVFALDQIGHGLNVESTDDLLIWEKDSFSASVENHFALIESLKKEGREVIVFAHSMGSFMGQTLIERHPGVVKKIVLCGTSGPQFVQKIGGPIARMHRFFTGNGYRRSKFLNHLCFASYNRKVDRPRTEFDWLSASETNVDNYIADPYCGAVPSRNFFASFIGSISRIYKKKNLDRIDPDTKVLFIVGEDDPVGNYVKSIRKLQRLYTKRQISSRLIAYPKLWHEILFEEGHEKIFLDVLDFLNEADF